MAQDEAAIATNGDGKPSKNKPARILPTDRLPVPRQLDLVRAYVSASAYGQKPVRVTELAAISKINPTNIYMANSFLTDIGLILKSDAGFLPSPEAISYARAYEWKPDTATQKLASLMRSTWFAEELLPKIDFRDVHEDEALGDLAQVAAAGPSYRNQIRPLLDFLETVGLIRREGEMLRKGRVPTTAHDEAPASPSASISPSTSASPSPSPAAREPQIRSTAVSTVFSQQPEGVVQFHVSVRVDMAELSGWAPERISAFFAGIAQVLAAKGAVEKGGSGA
jgi:hypothetical protein